MKKFLALALALCLLCGGVALADDTTINQDSTGNTGSTTVSYTIQPNETYTVTIPSSVTLTADEDSALTGSMTIALDASNFNVYGKTINVKLTGTTNDFNLVNGTNKIEYSLTRSDNTEPLQIGALVLNWSLSNGLLYEAYTCSGTYAIRSTIPAHAPAGNYTDTLTFTVSVDE